jgi:hypothetical protein
MSGSGTFLLISKAAVSQFEKSSADFRGFLTRFLVPGGPVRRFPNGAIEIDWAHFGGKEEHPLRSFASADCRLEGAAVFRTLGGLLPKRFYSIQYPADYQEKLRSEISFIGGQGRMSPATEGEFDLRNLSIAVIFRGRVGKDVRRAFSDAVAVWGKSAAEHGAFEDGPVTLASLGVTFSGSRARFHIDAGRSGQDTINWLTLAILDFGYEVHPVTFVKFGYTDAELDTLFGAAKREAVTVEFRDISAPANPPLALEGVPATFVPGEAFPDATVRSKSFRVLTLPINEWDSFVATVYFAESLEAEQRRDFVALVDAWLLLASYGGLGGRGTHSADEVTFDDSTDSAIIKADMGDTDPRTALRVLVRAVEGFQRGGGIAIDAIVFGSGGLEV